MNLILRKTVSSNKTFLSIKFTPAILCITSKLSAIRELSLVSIGDCLLMNDRIYINKRINDMPIALCFRVL